jgi:hypothetical protein
LIGGGVLRPGDVTGGRLLHFKNIAIRGDILIFQKHKNGGFSGFFRGFSGFSGVFPAFSGVFSDF